MNSFSKTFVNFYLPLTLLTLVFVFVFSNVSKAEPYASVYGGFNWDGVEDSKFVDSETGSVAGVTLGKSIGVVPGLRMEVDLSTRNNEGSALKFLSFDHETTAIMVNVAYDIPVKFPVTPYVLAGIGYADSSVTVENLDLATISKSGVAYQLGAGFNYQVTDGIKAGLGYRYLKTQDIDVLGFEVDSGSNHSVVAQMTFALN